MQSWSTRPQDVDRDVDSHRAFGADRRHALRLNRDGSPKRQPRGLTLAGSLYGCRVRGLKIMKSKIVVHTVICEQERLKLAMRDILQLSSPPHVDALWYRLALIFETVKEALEPTHTLRRNECTCEDDEAGPRTKNFTFKNGA